MSRAADSKAAYWDGVREAPNSTMSGSVSSVVRDIVDGPGLWEGWPSLNAMLGSDSPRDSSAGLPFRLEPIRIQVGIAGATVAGLKPASSTRTASGSISGLASGLSLSRLPPVIALLLPALVLILPFLILLVSPYPALVLLGSVRTPTICT